MSVVARLAGFVALAAVVFLGAWWVGSAVGPVESTPTTVLHGVSSTTMPSHAVHPTDGEGS